MLDILTLTLNDALLVSGQLWFVLALVAYQWVDYEKIINFFLTTGQSLTGAKQERKRQTGEAKDTTVQVSLKHNVCEECNND